MVPLVLGLQVVPCVLHEIFTPSLIICVDAPIQSSPSSGVYIIITCVLNVLLQEGI